MVYRASGIRALAVAQMVMGSLMIVFAIASIAAVHASISYIGFGTWIGVWVIITGVLGYVGARSDTSPNKCLIGTFMGFAITSCVLSGIMFIAYSVALSQFSRDIRRYRSYAYDDSYYKYHYHSRSYYLQRYHTARTGAGLGSILLILAIAEFFVAMASSIYCCNAVCCEASVQSTTQVQQVRYITPQPSTFGQPGGGVIVINPAGQATVQTIQGAPQMQTVMVSGQPMHPMQPVYWATPTGAVGGAVGGAPAPGASVPGAPPCQQPYQTKGAEMPPSYTEGNEHPM